MQLFYLLLARLQPSFHTRSKSTKLISMRKQLTTLYVTLAVLLGSTGATLGTEKSNFNCSNKDREYAKFWGNYYDPEDAYEFGRKIKKVVKEKNLEGLFTLVDGELTSGPRKRVIKGKKFSDIFSNHWRNDLLASDAPCSPAGWRGFMLASGLVWFNRKNGEWRVFSINGAREENIREANIPMGWIISEGLIPPQCFVKEWVSSDNFEEFEDKYNIPKEDCRSIKLGSRKRTFCQSTHFRKNPGIYLGKEITSLDGIAPSWDDKDRITLAAPVDLCFKGSVIDGRIGDPIKLSVKSDKKSKMIESKICSSETSCTEYAYSILTNVPLNKCQELAPNLTGQCRQSFLIAVGDYSGGSIGWDYGYNIYGLFSFNDKKRFIVPLKNFRKKNDAINYIEQSVK
ncbi:MAG: hypothetical protein CMM28_11200 [Rhodospirillaceae bacterium]|nr:hypothetical protein [Rhodospirillaceae bacterium]